MKSNEYLTFTKRERNGIISLIVILMLVMILGRVCRREPDVSNVLSNVDSFTLQVDSPVVAATTDKTIERTPLLYRQGKPPPRYTKKTYQAIEINIADTAAFIALPGIGSKLAARIVLFRERLGGFYSVQQIAEVYGLHDSVYRRLKPYLHCDVKRVKKININNAPKEEMQSHPYIRWKLAEAIVTYRNEHGPYASITDLDKIEMIDDSIVRRLQPYIDFR